MPIPLDPNERFEVSLPTDKDKPAESRPVFIGRYLTSRERMRVRQIKVDVLAVGLTDEQFYSLMGEALAVQLVGWENICDRKGKPIPFKIEAGGDGIDRLTTAMDALTDQEQYELVHELLAGAVLTESDKKKSLLQSALRMDLSAPNASTNATSQKDRATDSPSHAQSAMAAATNPASDAPAIASSK